MREVALRAKVSTSTVSLALRNSPLVAAETRGRIRAVAEVLRYKTHPLVAAHMRSRRKPGAGVSAPVLAIVDTQRRRHGWRDNRTFMVRQMLAGAKARAAERGYETREFWLHEPGMSHTRFSEMLRARGIHGLLLGPSSDLQLELALEWEWFSVVRLGSARVTPALHRVVVDHYHAGMLAAQRAHAAGFRRPILSVREAFSVAHDRRLEGGFEMIWRNLPGIQAIPKTETDRVLDAATLNRWMREHRPDVIIDAEERQVLDLLKTGGWRVPEDVGVISLCVDRLGGPLTGCVQNGEALGWAGIDQLISLIERNETGVPLEPVTLATNVTWNDGQTVLGRGAIRPRARKRGGRSAARPAREI